MTQKLVRRATGSTLALALLVSVPVSSVADTGYQGIHPTMTSRFQITGGAFFAKTDPNFRLTGSEGIGTRVDLDDLGIDDHVTTGFGSLLWRINDRWRLEGMYYGFNSDDATQAETRIDWGDLEFDVGARIRSKTETDVGRVFGGYSFLKNDRAELGAGIGLHYLRFKVKLSGEAFIDGERVLDASEQAKVSGVVPNIGFFGTYALNERWAIMGRVDWFSASVDNFDGSLWRTGASVVYQPFKYANFGVGYDYLDIDVDIDGKDWDGKIKADYYGPSVFVGLTF